MAAIDFPNSPEVDDLFTQGDITWQWDGTVWRGLGTTATGPAGVTISDDAPESNQVLWLDTDEEPDVPVPAGGSAGQLLAKVDSTDYNTAWVTQEGYRFVQTLYFTSSGTFVKADYAWLRAIRVRVQGAGGGGGNANATASAQGSAGAGGGGGAYAESFITDIAGLDASITVTRGGGGAAGSPGATSSFGSLVTATGGGGGSARAASAGAFGANGGSGGTGATGQLVFSGTCGTDAYGTGRLLLSGSGGASHLGGGAVSPTVTNTGDQKRAGIAGGQYGGGGSGASNSDNVTLTAGGAGGNGIVIVDLFA